MRYRGRAGNVSTSPSIKVRFFLPLRLLEFRFNTPPTCQTCTNCVAACFLHPRAIVGCRPGIEGEQEPGTAIRPGGSRRRVLGAGSVRPRPERSPLVNAAPDAVAVKTADAAPARSRGKLILYIVIAAAVLAGLFLAGRQAGAYVPRFAQWVASLGVWGPA